MPGIGRDVDVLGDVGALGLERVVACLTIDHVAAITRIPHERVIAGPEQGLVAALPADNAVRAVGGGAVVSGGAALVGELALAGVGGGGVVGAAPGAAADDERVVAALGADRPLTTTDAPMVATLMLSRPAVPFTVTLSAAPSPWPLPEGPDKSMATCVTPVLVRSLIVMLSAPPAALTW